MIRSEKTRNYIIEKTASIFNKKGYTGTYLSDLTEATGLTKGSIYGNFKDKNEVALEAFRYNYHRLSEEVAKKMRKESRADKKLLIYLDHYKADYKNIFANGGCAILNTAVDADDGNLLLKSEVEKKIKGWIRMFVSVIEEGKKKKEIKGIDALKYAHKTIAIIEGSVMLAKTLNEPDILLNNIEILKEEVKQISIN